jgi:uncharacterized protein YkwD
MRRHVLVVGGVALAIAVAGIAVATTASAGTTTYEAEAATNTLTGGAQVVDCRRCSGGARVTGLGFGGSLTFAGVLADSSGAVQVAVTYFAAEALTASISLNGGAPVTVTFPAGRSATRPVTVRVDATLAAGQNTVSIGNPAGPAPDIDKLVVTTGDTPSPATTSPTVPSSPSAPAQPSPSAPSESGPSAPSPSAPTGPESSGPPEPSPSVPPSPSVSPSSPPTSIPPSPTPTGIAAFEAAVVDIVNDKRATAGCPALTVDDRLTTAARAHSADMAARDYFSHTTPEGVAFSARITNAGYRWSSAGENIAKGQRTPQEVMTAWMNSEGHRANILNCGFVNLGVGVAANPSGVLLWTQDFGTPR